MIPNDAPAAAGALAEAFQRQLAARDRPPDHEARMHALARLEALLASHEKEFCDAVDADFRGRSARETRLLELFPSVEAIRHARRHLKRWMAPQRRATNRWFLPGRSRVLPQPLGVVGIVVPWNYPIYLAIAPLVSALAAGNRVLVKMSEAAPATGRLLADLVARDFAADEVRVFNGNAEYSQAFVALPFDHLLFTGSTEVGRHVMRAAAANLVPVTLELGGKSPAIVGRDIAIDEAAERILHGKCLNAGQTCVAPDYVLVPEERVEAFVAAAAKAVARFYPRLVENADYTAIVNDRHRERLERYLEDARAKGARLVPINPAAEDFARSPKLPPTLVTGLRDDMLVMREEIFGPVLPVVPYRALDEAIDFVNRRPRPLALYVFDHDRSAIDRVLAKTLSGGVTVNETILHLAQEDLPFGGVGPSGMGEYHGRAGFETFSKRKAVFEPSRFNALALFRPPYGPRFDALVSWLLK